MSSMRPGAAGRRRACVALVGLLLLGTTPTVAGSGTGGIGASVRPSPLLVSLDVSTGRSQAGQAIQAQATVVNIGKTLVKQVTVELRFDPVGLRTAKAVMQIAQIKAGKSDVESWSVCGRRVGTYVLLARVTLDGVSIDSVARLLTITPGGKKVCP